MIDMRPILIAGPTAGGKSGLAAAPCRAARRRRHQRRFHAGLSRAAHPDRAPDPRGGGTRAARALWLRGRAPSATRPDATPPMSRARLRDARREGLPADHRRRHGALLQDADRGAVAHSRRSPTRCARTGAPRRPTSGAARAARHALGARSGDGGNGWRPATRSASCARSRCSRPPASRLLDWQRLPRAAGAGRGRRPSASSLRRRARSCTGASTCASQAMMERGRPR